MNRTSTTWRIPPLAWIPVALAIAAEATSNALRAYGLGAHLDRFTVTLPHVGQPVSIAGAVLVMAAVAVSLSQARAAWVALTPGPARQRIVAGLAAILLLAISVTAMASHILEAQRAKVADEGGERARYDRARDAFGKASAELSELAGVRSTETIRAAMDAAPVSRSVFRRTAQCTDMTREDSFAACKPLLDLRQEMGRAIRKAELEPQVASLRAELASLKRPEEATTSESAVSGYWAWIMGLGVVFVATFGTVIFARVETVRDDTAQTSWAATETDIDTLRQAFTSPAPSDAGPPRPPRGGRPMLVPPPTAPQHPLIAELQRGGPAASQDELARRLGVSKGEVSKTVSELGNRLSIERHGRCNRIALAS